MLPRHRNDHTEAVKMSVLDDAARVEALAVLSTFRTEFYRCLTARADALFEATDALLCTDGPVRSLVDLVLAPEHRRGHGAHVRRTRAAAASTWPGCAGRWQACRCLAPPTDASSLPSTSARGCAQTRRTSPDRLFCHVHGRGKGSAQMIPGWPYSFVAALETGRTSWTALLDAVRLGPADDAATVTADQLRDVVQRIIAARPRHPRRPEHPDRVRRRLRHPPPGVPPHRPAR